MAKKTSPIAAAIAADKNAAPSEGALERVRAAARQVRELEGEIADLEERLKGRKAELHELTALKLPDLFAEFGITSFALAPEGNMPGRRFEEKPFYNARITEERAPAAFAYLEDVGAGDLIKNTFTIALPRGKDALGEKLEAALRKLKLDFDRKRSVHPQTLTAWLREMVEKKGTVPDLEKIGGMVGRVVKVTEVK